MLAGCCWLAVRLVTRPLKQLAEAADTLGPDLKADRLPEEGPEKWRGRHVLSMRCRTASQPI